MKPMIKRFRLNRTFVTVCHLFRLPRELLEMVAEYFSRHEAVPVLAVNSTLHGIFAECIWRRLDTYIRSIPLDLLPRYGHLVRHMKIAWWITKFVDLAAVFPNVTHLFISLPRLADTAKSSQGKCFERLRYLDIWAWDSDYNPLERLNNTDSALSWIDSRFEDGAGLEKVEWEVDSRADVQCIAKILPWLQSHCAKDRIYFKLCMGTNLNNFGMAECRALVSNYLTEWFDPLEDDCAAAVFSDILDEIPPVERQHSTFPALKILKIGTCCDTGYEVYSQFNFGKLFPSVWCLMLDGTRSECDNDIDADLSSILIHPWPSVRKLEINSVAIFKNTISHLAVMSNVEELSITRKSEYNFDDWGVVNLCELDHALPKLVRLLIIGNAVLLAPPKQQQQEKQPGQQKLFRHLYYITLRWISVTSSAFRTLVHAPLLADVCLEGIDFKNDDYVDISHELDREAYNQLDSANNVDFLAGITNSTVRIVDFDVNQCHLLTSYENTIRSMLKCFAKLGVFIIRTDDMTALPGLLKEFSTVKLVNLE
ncbi:hypothetical protein GQ42DRAFT_181808 [Ramicandelaber brevisporus]|nr:hypothetical protein GQ42DRAFT_181808 [Ramicandelaber brevisporus]